jgi:SAM-dependent methyltransferase
VDISETFINRAREEAAREHAAVNFIVSDIRKLDIPSDFSVITWIEISLFDKDILEKIYRSLKKGGRFIVDARNPEHSKSRSRSGNWRTWREDNGVFTLERHEINPATGKYEDVWITIDTENEIIEEKSNGPEEPGLKSLNKTIAGLKAAGFHSFEVRTLESELFNGGEEPYWLWVVAVK